MMFISRIKNINKKIKDYMRYNNLYDDDMIR